jgi:hypothetical protein
MYIAHRIDDLYEVVHTLAALPKEKRREVVEEVRSYRSGKKDREKFDEMIKSVL